MNYYQKKLLIPQVDEQDTIIGKIERWDAHENGILHRGFTVGVFDTKGNMLLQHRKHPVFGNYYDLTASSHQIYEDDQLEDITYSIEKTLLREWTISKDMIKDEPKLVGKTLYKSSDGTYTEHELCHLYTLTLNTNTIPNPPEEFAYGYMVKPLNEIRTATYENSNGLAPWVIAFFDDGLL